MDPWALVRPVSPLLLGPLCYHLLQGATSTKRPSIGLGAWVHLEGAGGGAGTKYQSHPKGNIATVRGTQGPTGPCGDKPGWVSIGTCN